MGIILILVQILVVFFALLTIVSNEAFSFTIPEEMDYSVPFDFLSSGEEEEGLNINNYPIEEKDFDPKIGDTYFPGKVDSDIFLERENERPKSSYHTDYENDKDSENRNVLSKSIDPEPINSKNKSNSLTDIHENNYQKKNDNLEIDNMKQNSKSGSNDEKIAVINFDDNWKSQYDNAKSILDEYQFKSTFYIVCDYIDGKNRLTLKQIQSLQEEGHEIGSHTMNHENLDQITPNSKYTEIVQSKRCIEDSGFNVNSFSYPFNSGDDNQETLDLVSNTYDFARTAGGDSHKASNSLGSREGYERYTIVGWSHDAERRENNYSDLQMLEAFKEYVNQYDERSPNVGSIPIIIYHNIDDDRGMYSTSIDLFRSEMQYLSENGFKVVTMNQVFGGNNLNM